MIFELILFHLEYSFNVVVTMEHGEDVQVGKDDTEVVYQCRSPHLLIDEDFHDVLHDISCGYVDHHLRILFVVCGVEQMNVFSH